ncbi:MAG: flagellar biosynthetic protein FliO [Candidatus Zixiibacteriota bacterium]|nr:MAG: flagellar biosynthetic protein FliO [candidate division Zixibacteria bacterium]
MRRSGRLLILPPALALWTAAAAAQAPGDPGLGAASVKAFFSLLLVLGLILVCAWLAKRYLHLSPPAAGRSDTLQVLASRTLGPRRSVHLLEVEGRRFLVGSGEAGVTLIKDMDTPPGESAKAKAL